MPAPGSTDLSDRDLLQRAAAGDRRAFEALYGRHKHVIYRFARAMTGSADAAADVTQEVFLAFMRELARYDPDRSSVTTYLYGVARNLTRERLRRERRFLSLEAVGLAMPRTDTAGLDEELSSTEDVARVRAALRTLPPRYREVIVLCDLHDRSYDEAAAIVRASVGAVRSRLHRARRLLRERLQREKVMYGRRVGVARAQG
jgi:RNA polymerase sigma-70 factor (ECF subfamily)